MKVLAISLCLLPACLQADPPLQKLEETIVTGKAQNLLEEALTASEGSANRTEIAQRPLMRRSEILEMVPGMITTQHTGGGKATQYFLRGYNLDHGTDFSLSLAGMPLNMRSHAHGQGYTDLNGIIPELISSLEYQKGPFHSQLGDLSSAGGAEFHLVNELERGFLTLEAGEYGWQRALLANSFHTGPGILTLASEWNSYDGPWTREENFDRFNLLTRYFQGDEENHVAITAMSYQGTWDSSDQIPLRAVTNGLIPRYGTIDPSTGGDSRRHSIQAEWLRTEPQYRDRIRTYAVFYELDLFSNFTYFQEDPVNGDQFEQAEQRTIIGGDFERRWQNRQLASSDAEYALGLQLRHDSINNIGLYHTRNRKRIETLRVDDILETSIGLHSEASIRWTPWLRTVTGLRVDAFNFDVTSDLAANSGNQNDAILSPRLSAIFGPWQNTEIYTSIGTGFHSNDARGINNTIDPVSGDPVRPVDPLVRTIGAEIGVRSHHTPHLTTTLSFWWLDSDSELVYVGDAGTNEAGPASRRFGIEAAAYWQPIDGFTADAELALTHARFRKVGPDDEIPNSIPAILSGGITVGREHGAFGSLRARAFSPRTLEESGSIEGRATFTLNARIGYRTENWQVALDCLNLLDRQDRDIEYLYSSQLPFETSPVDDIHFHPAEPRMIRASITRYF